MTIQPVPTMQVWSACKQIAMLNKLADSQIVFPDTLNLARMIFKDQYPKGVNRFNEQLDFAAAVTPGLYDLHSHQFLHILDTKDTWWQYMEWTLSYRVMLKIQYGEFDDSKVLDVLKNGTKNHF